MSDASNSRHCTVDARQRARAAADTISAHETVAAVDVLEPAAEPTDRWAVEVTTAAAVAAVPPDVLDVLGSYRLALRDVTPQGRHWRALAVAST